MTKRYDTATIPELVVLAQNGDARALDRLLAEWRPKLLRLAAGVVWNEDAAQDVVQETMTRLAQHIGQLANPAAFPSWAYTIARRESVEYLRRERRFQRERVSLDDAEIERDIPDLRAVFEPSVEMEQCLDRLRLEDRELLSLHYWCGLDLREIAQVFDIAAGAVKTRLFRARGRLGELLCLPPESISAS